MQRLSSKFWLALSLVFAAGYGVIWLKAAFAGSYIMQADAGMYMFWMQRFSDPTLLPHDLNVAYHSSISPPGYTAVYQSIARLGMSPVLLNKLLPIALTLTTTVYCFRFCLQLLPVPAVAFVSTLLFNQHLWLTDDVNSATPRSFVYPFFFAFLYYLSRGAAIRAIVAIGLVGLFYPPMMFVGVGVLAVRLVSWAKGRLWLSKRRQDYRLLAAGVVVAGVILLPYGLLGHAEFGSLVTAAQARVMPEFQAPLGRISFFNDRDPLNFWFDGIHSGLGLSLNPIIVSVGLLLPFLWRFPNRFPLVKQCRPAIALLPQMLVSSIALFLAAHALLFRLFLPSRYTMHTLRMVVAIAGGLALCILLDAAMRSYQQHWGSKNGQHSPLVADTPTTPYTPHRSAERSRRSPTPQPPHRSAERSRRSPTPVKLVVWSASALLAIVLLFYPQIFWQKHFTKAGLVTGREPALYEFLQQQPKDSLIATLSGEADNISVFAQRSVLVSPKYAIPYHPVYYNQIRQRAIDLIHAQYSLDPSEVEAFVQKYGVDFWLVERDAFTPAYLNDRWLHLFEPAPTEARAHLATAPPVVAQRLDRCKVFETGNLVVLKAACP